MKNTTKTEEYIVQQGDEFLSRHGLVNYELHWTWKDIKTFSNTVAAYSYMKYLITVKNEPKPFRIIKTRQPETITLVK